MANQKKQIKPFQQACGEYHDIDVRKNSGSRLEGTAEEQQIVGRLFETLERKGGEYVTFGENVKVFLYNMRELGKRGQDFNQISHLLKATCSYAGILIMQRNNPNDELVNATMSYLHAKYPKHTKR